MLLRTAVVAAAAAAGVASAADSAGEYFVHARSASSRRVAAWARAKCGAFNKGSDIPTSWGLAVTPANVHPEYPRPQMTRPAATFANLNGLWEWQWGAAGDAPPFGRTLNGTILVPFPPESCLSGVGTASWPTYSKYSWYRLLFDAPFAAGTTSLLHFGAIDWNATVYLNGALLGTHIGGYDGFTLDATGGLTPTNNELIVGVYDPSDEGYQPHGKQRISAIPSPGGDTYTPSSGIWQTVWMEGVPAFHIDAIKVRGGTENLYLTVTTAPNVPGTVAVAVSFAGAPVTTAVGDTFTEMVVPIPNPQLWNVGAPALYDLVINVTEPSTGNTDAVGSYFGMRTVSLLPYTTPPTPGTGPRVGWDNPGGDLPGSPFVLPQADYNLCWAACNKTEGCNGWSYGVPNCGGDGASPQCWLKSSPGGWGQQSCRVAGDQPSPGGPGMRPAVNGQFSQHLAGWLDQSWWPDGLYTAPTDDALAFDLQAVGMLGFNTIRLHQKVNPERWYYHADRLGVAILQDAVQKYGGASAATIEPFLADLKAMIDGRYSHPSILQWDVFNEGDCVGVFPNVSDVVAWVQGYDPSRLVDTNSGGPANDLHVGDVNDYHCYPGPCEPQPSATQYAMVGEYAGLGWFPPNQWAPGGCYAYRGEASAAAQANDTIAMSQQLTTYKGLVSVSILTQITDLEEECDGIFDYTRNLKFDNATLARIVAANQALIHGL